MKQSSTGSPAHVAWRLASRNENLMLELTLSPQSGSMNSASKLKTHVHCYSTNDPRFYLTEPRLGSDSVQHEMKNKGNVVILYFSFKETGKNRLSTNPLKRMQRKKYCSNKVCERISVLVYVWFKVEDQDTRFM
jgi:hypothetical protein